MAGRLNADLDALELFAAQLDVTRSQFDATGTNISGAAAGLGSPKVSSALEDFDRRWRAGREVLDSYFNALSKMVGDSAETLRRKDAELAQIRLVRHRPVD